MSCTKLVSTPTYPLLRNQNFFSQKTYAVQTRFVHFRLQPLLAHPHSCHLTVNCRKLRIMFGLVVPGREVQTDFVEEAEGRWLAEIPGPGDISELCVFLARPLAVMGVAVGVYYSFSPFADFEFLGVLTNGRPSGFFSTGWALHPEAQMQPFVRIGLCVESEAELLEKMRTAPPTDFKKEYARKVALNLFNFIESFRESGESAIVARPEAVLQTWLKRFEDKYQLDPNFVMRSE